ncbi:hypothetical protein LGT41_0002610 [Abyssibius alkaniclasticus]|uniref:hypothetical protein n=1 Tax=Abyssibius alkaniclasticus TaxID=2881234 RepID=UPI0023645739|nr:hypothetical protein [Abyssibius alkaniclasticus]UPH71729.1 hypothetical protein LGT41_0002610 [Abyssibius alkaniclasticus]
MSSKPSPKDIVVAAVDVGSPKNIGWAIIVGGDVEHGTNLDTFIARFAEVSNGKPSALGFEAPLFIPYGRPLQKLTAQRSGDNGRPWSAGAGATVTTIGLAVVSHVLSGMRAAGCKQRAVLDWQSWPRNDDLLLFEAFVSGDNHAGPGEHWKDALNAAEGFVRALPDLSAANAVSEANVFSMIGACMMRTGWAETGIDYLSQSCLVIRP